MESIKMLWTVSIRILDGPMTAGPGDLALAEVCTLGGWYQRCHCEPLSGKHTGEVGPRRMDSSSDDEPGLSAASYVSTGLAEALLRPLDYVRAVRELGTICARAFQSSHRTLQKQLADDVALAVQQCSW